MSIVSMRPLLEVAKEENYAYGAFNVNAVCQIEAAIRMHEIMRSPCILQGAELANGFMGGRSDFAASSLDDRRKGMENMVSAYRKYAQNATIPVVLHLDHGQGLESCKAAIDAGYTSVMIDGSSKPLEENIELTKSVVEYARPRGVSVEGELGVLAGVEDHVYAATSTYTNPLDALRFIKETGVDALAISYGTMHGANKGKNVKLRREIPIAVNELLRYENIFCALVSHGSSNVPLGLVEEINMLGGELSNTGGIPVRELQEVIASGISKINVDTDIRLAVTRNIREYYVKSGKTSRIWDIMQSNPKAFDPRAYLTPIMDILMYGTDDKCNEEDKAIIELIKNAVMEVTSKLISAYGSDNRAKVVERRVHETYLS